MPTWSATPANWSRRSKRWKPSTPVLARIYQALKPRGGAWIITADHGNAETMIDPNTGGPHTYHTTNPVPFVLVTDDDHITLKADGSLRDIAPTMLGVLGQPQPKDMTGRDLRVIKK